VDLTWPIVYEFLRVSTHLRVFRTPWPVDRTWQFVEALLASPGLGVLAPTARHADVAAEVIAELPFLSGNLMHDAHTAVLMREHGIRRVYTRDTDFHRFPFVEPVDPLGAA
jgi:predicted nucleic acid-binding protein